MKSDKLLQMLAAESRDPLLLIDISGKILWWNEASEECFGLQILETQNAKMLFSSSDTNELFKRAGSSVSSVEIPLKAGGTLRQSCVRYVFRTLQRDNEYSLLLFQSGLSQKDAPESVRADLLAGAAHDLKNPIGAIFGYADTLLDTEAGNDLGVKSRPVVERIRATTSRALELIKNYQHLSEMESLGAALPNAKIELNQTIHSIIEYTWRDDANTAPLTLELHAQKMLVALTRVDLERILSNLLTNAMKFTPSGGEVFVKTYIDSLYGCFSVNNKPAFIPENELQLIFDKYGRGTKARDISGSGLGLYIVKFIVGARGGLVDVSSSEKEGTTFTIKLPLALS